MDDQVRGFSFEGKLKGGKLAYMVMNRWDLE